MNAARNLALEALYAGKEARTFSERLKAHALGRAAIAALEAETGEVAAWIGHSQVTGLKFAAMPDEHRSEACAPWIPLYTAPPPAVPTGWKLVPIEPTEEMLSDDYGLGSKEARRLYQTMLSAAPGAPA